MIPYKTCRYITLDVVFLCADHFVISTEFNECKYVFDCNNCLFKVH